AICFLCNFFFFQAEDGIRDFHVTGVQTCALPISKLQHCDILPAIGSGCRRGTGPECSIAFPLVSEEDTRTRSGIGARSGGRFPRSEERRVGKEGGYRGWADPSKKEERRSESTRDV